MIWYVSAYAGHHHRHRLRAGTWCISTTHTSESSAQMEVSAMQTLMKADHYGYGFMTVKGVTQRFDATTKVKWELE